MSELYRTVFELEILSNSPRKDWGIEEVVNDMINGDSSGQCTVKESQKLSNREMALALQKQGSDPEFLLGEDGWVYGLDTGDEVKINTGSDEKNWPPIAIQTIEYITDKLIRITSKEGEAFECKPNEIS